MSTTDLPRNLPITIDDIIACGHCPRMRFFFRQHGLYDEFRGMVKGIPISSGKMLDTGDVRAINVVKRKAAQNG